MSNTFRKYKLGRTRLIMAISYVLLMGFAIQWLYTQYEKEENTLQKELSKLFDPCTARHYRFFITGIRCRAGDTGNASGTKG